MLHDTRKRLDAGRRKSSGTRIKPQIRTVQTAGKESRILHGYTINSLVAIQIFNDEFGRNNGKKCRRSAGINSRRSWWSIGGGTR